MSERISPLDIIRNLHPDQIKTWSERKGPRGPFELTKDGRYKEYHKILRFLLDYRGFYKDGYNYWLSNRDEITILRRRAVVEEEE